MNFFLHLNRNLIVFLGFVTIIFFFLIIFYKQIVLNSINMDIYNWLIFFNGMLLGWWLPIISKLLFVELPVQLRLSKDKLYNERKPYGKK